MDRHRDAMQRAYEECARDEGAVIEDDVAYVEPLTYWPPNPGAWSAG